MSHQLARRWFTASEYRRMAEAGILTEDDRVELIEGEIVEMSPIGSRHAACVNRLNMLLGSQAGQDLIISVQNPIAVDDYSEPGPDVAVLRMRGDYYAEELPKASDVLLVIEVADTSAESDRAVKIPLYARAGVPTTVLVDLQRELVEVHARPAGAEYQSVHIFRRSESIRLEASKQLTLSVDAVLG